MKNKFNFKKEYYDIIKELTDKQAGELVKGICGYVFEGKAFVTKDDYLKGVFLYLKRELDVSALNSVNGKKGADKLAENKRTAVAMKNFAVLGGILAAAVEAQESEGKGNGKK